MKVSPAKILSGSFHSTCRDSIFLLEKKPDTPSAARATEKRKITWFSPELTPAIPIRKRKREKTKVWSFTLTFIFHRPNSLLIYSTALMAATAAEPTAVVTC